MEVSIVNGEKLTLTVTYTMPEGLPAGVKGTPSVSLTYGTSTFGEKVDDLITKRTPTITGTLDPAASGSKVTYKWVLDSLEGEQFKGLVSAKLGGDFTVTAGLTLKADGWIDSAYYAEGSDNSLFATGSATAPHTKTALIANLRHLQNLHPDHSNVDDNVGGTITKAVQVLDVDCKGEAYNFIPIVNGALTSYNGNKNTIKNLYVSCPGDAGLFGSVTSNITFEQIRLLAPEIISTDSVGLTESNAAPLLARVDEGGCTLKDVQVIDGSARGTAYAGGLVGLVNAAASCTIENCRVYWNTPAELVNKPNIVYKVSGGCAGGLIGFASGTAAITRSFAATTVNGASQCGGLVGMTGANPLTVTNSYADCYLTGSGATGGLIGKGSADLTNCYAAGFIMDCTDTAGLAGGTEAVNASKCYSVVRLRKDADGKETLAKPARPMYENWNESASGNTAYYFSTVEDVTEAVKGVLGPGFEYVDTKPETHVYDLRYELSKTSSSADEALKLKPPYPFPGLVDLPHYSDWAELENKDVTLELVYYEGYDNEEWGVRFSVQLHENDKNSPFNTLRKKKEEKLEDKRVIESDGYALAVKKDELKSLQTQKTRIVWSCIDTDKLYWALKWEEGWQWGKTTSEDSEPDAWVSVDSDSAIKDKDITVGKDTYTLIPLPVDLVYGGMLPVSQQKELTYNQKLTVQTGENAEREFYFNPHFAIEIQGPGKDGSAPSKPSDGETKMIIRTPRHFYNLSRTYDKGCNYPLASIQTKTFVQDFDLDYETYKGRIDVGKVAFIKDDFTDGFFPQDPVPSSANSSGTTDGPTFHYDGQNHRIRKVFIKPGAKDYVGLFRQLDLGSTLKNVVFEMDPGTQQTIGGGSANDYAGALLGYCNNGGRVENCAVYGVNIYANAAYIGGLVGYCNNNTYVVGCSAEVACLNGTGIIGGLVGTLYSKSAQLHNSYAVGYINKTSGDKNIGGLVGHVEYSGTTIENCYAAVRLESKGTGKKYGLCSKGAVKNSYWLKGTFRYRGAEYTVDDKTYAQDSKGGATAITPYELVKVKFVNSEGKYTGELKPATSTVYSGIPDGTKWKADYADKSFPYLTSVKGLDRETNGEIRSPGYATRPIHYGLWPVEIPPEVSLFYFEEYKKEKDDKGNWITPYGVYRAIRETGKDPVFVDTLNNEKVIVRDGYALAVKKQDLPWFVTTAKGSSRVSVQYGAGGTPYTFTTYTDSTNKKSLKWDEERDGLNSDDIKAATAFEQTVTVKVGDEDKAIEYVMLPLWDSVHTGKRPNASGYNQSLTVKVLKPDKTEANGKRTFYFNPHFAKALSCPAEGSTATPVLVYPTTGQNLTNVPNPIYVRTARHFNSLSKFTDEYVKDKKYNFLQERDVDYRTYKGYGLPDKLNNELVYEQRVIGQGTYKESNFNDKFIGTYDGGCHRLKNVVFAGKGIDKRGLGLFGMIGENGRLKNMIYEPGGPASVNCNISEVYDDKDNVVPASLYVGGLAGSNFKGTIENCSVLGFKVSIYGDLNTEPHKTTIDNFYVGSLVGLNQYGTVSNCFAQVWNLDVPTAETANATTFAVGALVGCSYGVTEADSALVENCFAVGTISGGKGAKLSGLVGQNGHNGFGYCTIKNSYSAVALMSEEADKYNICSPYSKFSVTVTGKVENCYYLSDTWYYYGERYDTTASLLDASVPEYNSNITAQTYEELKKLKFEDADGNSLMGNFTGSAEAYPFPVSTKDKSGWHYFGTNNWPKKQN